MVDQQNRGAHPSTSSTGASSPSSGTNAIQGGAAGLSSAALNTRDCPELLGKTKSINAQSAAEALEGEEDDGAFECGYTMNELLEMFPFCTRDYIENVMAQYPGEDAMLQLADHHKALQNAAQQGEEAQKTRSQAQRKPFSLEKEERKFPKLSLEKEWEMVDELEEWEKVDAEEKKKTWAEKMKESADKKP
ncbi:unnamed protein product [Amoebophrya sp. A25]|nr:unnamed protein product [Amoebophrya sp. A25]|eukprot:GSA25T00004352001.1